jgi:hypothetical protein
VREKMINYRRRIAIGAAAALLALGAGGTAGAEAGSAERASSASRYNGDVYYYPNLKIYYNGVEDVTGEQGEFFNGDKYVPITLHYKGTAYVPIRYFSNMIGIEDIGWDGESQLLWVNSSKPEGVSQSGEAGGFTAIETYMTAKGSKHYEIVTLRFYPNLMLFFNGTEDHSGQDGLIHNGLDNVPKTLMVEGTTYVPLRYFATQFGIPNDNIVWDPTTPKISINMSNEKEEKPIALRETKGNSTGNLNNNGHYAFHDEWMYYLNRSDEGRLYKQKMDGSEIRQVGDDTYVESINIVNDKLYYLSNHKVIKSSLDGTERVVLRDLGAGGLNVMAVVGEWIYYTEKPGDMFGSLYRMRTDGTSIELLESNPVSRMLVDKGKIYYVIHTHKLFVMNASGSSKKKLLSGSITSLELAGGKLYFNDNGQLYSMSTDGEALAKFAEHNAQNLNVNGDWLYYSNHSEYSKKLYRISLTDKTIEKLSDQKTFYLNIVGEKIFFYNPDTGNVVSLPIE